jgi:hypothetical protein
VVVTQKKKYFYSESSRDGGGKRQFTAGCSFQGTPVEQPQKFSVGQNYTKKEVTHEKKKFNEVDFKQGNNCQFE